MVKVREITELPCFLMKGSDETGGFTMVGIITNATQLNDVCIQVRESGENDYAIFYYDVDPRDVNKVDRNADPDKLVQIVRIDSDGGFKRPENLFPHTTEQLNYLLGLTNDKPRYMLKEEAAKPTESNKSYADDDFELDD